MCDLSNPIYHDKDKAREHLEAIRWPNGPICPHCGVVGTAYAIKGKSARPGLYKCKDCRKQFTVTVGTVFERSKVPLNKWLLAVHLMTSSKKGYSAHQLHRNIGVTYKTAWFMAHRIREAMAPEDNTPMGEGGGIVEVDETYFGQKKGKPVRRGPGHKRAVVTAVERGGRVKSTPVYGAVFDGIKVALKDISREAHLVTDAAKMYNTVGRYFASHEKVNHSINEWARGNVHTNTVESFFSVFKRGMKGVYQHCSEPHLHRYLSEFDFRYNYRAALEYSDKDRANAALAGIGGKRLTYRRPMSEVTT